MKSTIIILIFGLGFGNCALLNTMSTSSASLNSVSTSINAISTSLDSVSSISNSIASVSGSSMKKKDPVTQFQMDVRDLTYIHVQNNLGSDWETDIQKAAQKNGILNWRTRPESFLGIGEGLKKSRLEKEEFEEFAGKFKKNPKLYGYLKEGYTRT